MVRPEGVEPSAYELKVRHSTAELRAYMVDESGVAPLFQVFQTCRPTVYLIRPFGELRRNCTLDNAVAVRGLTSWLLVHKKRDTRRKSISFKKGRIFMKKIYLHTKRDTISVLKHLELSHNLLLIYFSPSVIHYLEVDIGYAPMTLRWQRSILLLN